LSIGKYDVPEPLGMDQIKKFVKLTLMSKKGRQMAKGILLLGPPGTGKTHFAKWVGGLCGLKVIVAELAQIFGSLVGETEQNMKRFIEVVSANAPCVLLIDEIEKGLAGMGKRGTGSSGDGGVTERAMGQFLKFLSDDRPEGVYIIATCNNIDKLPPEWVRAERWDTAPFFIDIPNEDEQLQILDYYRGVYEVKGEPTNMDGWSGAEIQSVCRIAAMMEREVPDAERFVIPVSKTMAEDIKSLRSWAKNRCIKATMEVNAVKKKKVDRALAL
jgi:SpoVK/Ycf46/Vps4 family AAA+-type ATPase